MNTKYILAIETSTEHLGVSVCTSTGDEIASYNDLAYRHLSKDLHIAISQVMQEAKISYDQLEMIAVSKGPGSFTSIRLGISAAKGLAFSYNTPIVSVTSLECLAYSYKKTKALTVWIEAHGGNIYAQKFENHKAVNSPISIKANEAGAQLKKGETLIGNGVIKHRESIPEAVICPENHAYINPKKLAKLAWERYQNKTDDVNNTEALYVQALTYNKTYNKDGSKK